MIYLITNRSSEYDREELEKANITLAKGKDFLLWLNTYEGRTQLDTETNVCRDIHGWKRERKGKNKWHDPILDEYGNKIPENRKCYVVQIGDEEGINQWIFDVPGLNGKKLSALESYLRSDLVKILHNALFDYTVIKWNFGIDIKNIRCTFLMSKILYTGRNMGIGWHSFAGCAKRYLGIDISKAAQTTFDGNPMSSEQVLYAAIDVAPLIKLHDAIQKDINYWGLENVVRLECALVRPYGDAMCDNFYLNIDPWRDNMKAQQKELEEITQNLYDTMIDHFKDECEELGFIQANDHYDFKWNSPKSKKELMRIEYPMLPDDCTTIIKYKRFYKEILEDIDNGCEREDPTLLEYYLNKDFNKMEQHFISNHHNALCELGIFTPKGTININFNSSDQTTKLFKLVDPTIENSNKDTISKLDHPLAKEFKKFSRAAKLVTSYGENFIDYVAPDGKLRIPKVTQILETGRTSLGLYQLLPGDNKYRNCFYPPRGWKVVGVDYSSQEAVVAATFSDEAKLLDAIKNNYDFHSVSASIMFPDEWQSLGGDPKPKGKPDNKELLKLRQNSKVTSFGLMYGKSAVGLADDLGLFVGVEDLINNFEEEADNYIHNNDDEGTYTPEYAAFVHERYKGRFSKTSRKMFLKEEHKSGKWKGDIVTGDDLVERFYKSFPNIRSFLVDGADVAVQKSHIRTPDIFGRIRFFDPPDDIREEKAIHRQAMNYPIQASSANMTKYAIVLCKKYIEENDLQDKVKFFLPIHDEAIFIAVNEFADEWLEIQIKLMEKAGEVVLKNNLQKAEGAVSQTWQK